MRMRGLQEVDRKRQSLRYAPWSMAFSCLENTVRMLCRRGLCSSEQKRRVEEFHCSGTGAESGPLV